MNYRIFFLTALLIAFSATFLPGCSANQSLQILNDKNSDAVIYGEDGRLDYYEVTDPEIQKLVNSTAVFIDNSLLIFHH